VLRKGTDAEYSLHGRDEGVTPMLHGVQAELVGTQWKLWDVPWPSCDDFPGKDELLDGSHAPPTPWNFSKRLLEEVRTKFEEAAQKRPLLQALYQAFAGNLADSIGGDPAAAAAASTVHSTWLHAALTFADRLAHEVGAHSREERLGRIWSPIFRRSKPKACSFG
jgi:hypothetical protein